VLPALEGNKASIWTEINIVSSLDQSILSLSVCALLVSQLSLLGQILRELPSLAQNTTFVLNSPAEYAFTMSLQRESLQRTALSLSSVLSSVPSTASTTTASSTQASISSLSHSPTFTYLTDLKTLSTAPKTPTVTLSSSVLASESPYPFPTPFAHLSQMNTSPFSRNSPASLALLATSPSKSSKTPAWDI